MRTLLYIGIILSIVSIETIYSLDNGLARTPPMGWVNWERFTCQTDCDRYPDDCVSEKLFKQMIDRVVEDGWLELGYEYVNIDDCWSELARNDSGQLVADHLRFPGGLEPLTRYAHDKGVKMGTYGDCGIKTCAGYPAQLKSEARLEDNHFLNDAKLLADSWHIDSFKFDGCFLDPSKAESICPKMAIAFNQTNRPTMLICEWPFYMLVKGLKPDYNLAQKACNVWRYYDDVQDSWLSILNIIDFTTKIQRDIVKYHGPGSWFDPDQLVIGNFALSHEQARAQMALWCIWSAPLYMSNDLRRIDHKMASYLKNKKLIAIDQDRLGVFGVLANQTADRNFQAFVKPVEPIKNGCPSFAIVYLNRHTLGNKGFISFPLRQLLYASAIKEAEERYEQFIKPGVAVDGSEQQQQQLFTAEQCRLRLLKSMTRQPIPENILVNTRDYNPIEEQTVTYQVDDLFNDDIAFKEINLDSDLSLMVNPNGVRAIKLVEK